MASYRLTPAERRARAQAIVKARENRSLYNQYQEEIKKQQEKERLESIKAENDKNNQSWFVRGLSTIGDIAANVLTGAAKGLEGIYDFGAGIVGAVGGIFNKDFQDDVQKHIAYDWTSENIGNPLQELTKYSYTNDWGTVGELIEGAASGVGQMLPAVAVSFIPGAGTVAANAALFSSAAGNATESAYNDGANYYGGLGYGLASGAVELATERLTGGATKGIFGKGMLDNVGKSIADTGLKRVAKNALSEGVEEVLAEAANPALKAIYKGKNALSEYEDGEYWKGVGKAGAIGSLTALAYSGTFGYGLAKRGKGYVGAEADINDSLQEIEGQKEKRNNLFTYDKLSVENEAKIAENVKGNYQNIERTLQKAKPEKRAKLIKEFRLESAFEADGTMNADFASTLDYTKQVEAITENGVNGSENAVASLDKRYINPDLIGQGKKVGETLATATEDLRQKYMQKNNATYEQAVEAVKDITPFKKNFTDKGKASYSKFKKGLNYLNRISGHTVNMVVVDEHDGFNGHIADDTIYIGADTFENDTWAGTLVHEYTHFMESSEEYTKLVQYLSESQDLAKKTVREVFGKGYVGIKEMEGVYDKLAKGEKLTEDESKMLNTYQSELGAHLTENLLGNEAFIDRLVGKETSLAEKVLNKITDLKKMFERIGNAEARAEYKQIKKAEKIYLAAVEKAGYAYINRKIVAVYKREEVDKNEEIQYNKKYFKFLHKNFPDERDGVKNGVTTAHRIALDWARNAKTGNQTLIYYKDHWYKVERFDDALNNYQVEEFITKAEFESIYKEIKEYGRSGKIESIQGRVDWIDSCNRQSYSLKRRGPSLDGLESRYGAEDNQIQRVGKKQVERGERTSSDERRNSANGSTNRQINEISFSLKDSKGNSLTKEQAKFFADSKVRDEQGNLLVVYHGTEGTFFTFDKALRGANTGSKDAKLGFFFTDSLEIAKDYAIEAQENKYFNLMHEVAMGDNKVLTELMHKDYFYRTMNVKDLPEPYKSYGEISEKVDKDEYDIIEIYLNVINPLEVDWKGKTYKKAAMLRIVTQALGEGHDGVIVRNIDDSISSSGIISDVFVAFEPNQIKATSNKKPTLNDDIRYSLKADINDYTEKQYNNFGWARVNDVLSYRENADFRSKYAKIKSGQTKAIRTKNGEIIVAVNDGKDDSFGVDNVLVYVKGSLENYKINKIVKINLYDETSIEIVRSEIYEREKSWTRASDFYADLYEEELVREYTVEAFQSYQDIKRAQRERGGRQESGRIDENYQREQDGRRNLGENQGNVSFSLKADINDYTEEQYNDFGWARVNDVLSYRENGNFRAKYGEIKSGKQSNVHRTASGEIIVETNDMEKDEFGINNVLVFAKGTYENYKITRVIRLKLNSETHLDIVRGFIYEYENDTNAQTRYTLEELYGEELIEQYDSRDFDDYRTSKARARARGRGTQSVGSEQDSGIGAIGRGNPDKNSESELGKFSLKAPAEKDKYFSRLSDGQEKKALANYTKFKVYSKVDAESIINNVLGNYMSFGESYGVISGKTKNEVIEMLWRGLNTAEKGKQAKVSLDIAEYIIKNAVLENIYEDDSNQVYIDTIQVLKPYLHSINLNGIKGDIKHKYDRDNSPYLLWGKRKEHGGKGADVIAMELEEQGFYIDGINEADIFFQIDTAYREAVAALKKQAKELLDSSLSKEERYELKQQIAKEVLRGFDYQGKPSKLAEIVKNYSDKVKFWKDRYYDERKRNTDVNRLLDSVQKIKDIKLGTFLNASQFDKNEIFKGSILKLSNIKYRGDLNKSGTRKIVAGLQEWYTKKNPMLENCFDEEVASMLEEIATGEGDLSTTELRALTNVVDYFKHFIETYNKVYRNGKYVDAQPIVEKYIGILQANKSVKVGWLPRVFDKVFNNANGSYLQTFADPMTVARYMDMYDDGFYTEMLTALREGATKAQIDEMTMREPIEEFLKKHKKYMQGIEKRKVKYLGQDIPAREALALYMTLGREQALAGLAESGFEYNDRGESIRVAGFAPRKELTLFELIEYGKLHQEKLASQFTEADLEYIEIARRLFNEVCRDKKKETDLKRKGYSNIAEGEYVPIRRANISHSVDTSTLEFELNRVSNASFNKDTVKGAKNELFIEALDRVLDRHIRAIAQYANLSLPIDEYNMLYNLDVGGNPNNVISLRTEGKNSWAKGDEYFRKLIGDIQGIPATKGEGLRAVSFIRGSYAKYQLGANPKVWLTQLSSFGAAGSMLDVGSIIKGMAIKTSDVDEYCALAKLRNNDNTAAMAQGVLDRTAKTGVVLDKVNKTGDLLMKPIGMVDRFVIKKLFGACQVQVEKNNGLKVGTEENKVKAGELLEKVILETQQNSMATERSAAMRSGSELMRTITMFSADSMKVIGRVVDSVGKLSVLKAKRKATTDPDEIAKLDKKIKSAKKKVAKSTAALATSAVFMALIAQLFRWLYNKDDEDENIVQNMTVDAIGNLLGGLPLIKDVYSRFAEGYDISNYTYSSLNDLLDSGYNIFAMVGDVFSGETDSQDVAKNIKNLFYASGQILGLPTRNVYNMVYGLTKRFSSETAYKIDSWFYDQNYSSDLAKAIENEDDEKIATIVGIMLDENIGGIDDSSVRNELDNLIKKGFSVLPRSVGDSITYEGEEITLTSGQAKSFKEVYSIANEALAILVGLSQYKSATDEVKAKAVNFIWDIYYNLAIEEVLGVDIVSKAVLFAEAIDIEKLAIIIATAREIEADTDKNGKSISGTRKAKIQKYVASLKLTAVQKYMIMGYLGYSNKNGKNQVKAHINRLNLSKTEKEKLLEYSGY